MHVYLLTGAVVLLSYYYGSEVSPEGLLVLYGKHICGQEGEGGVRSKPSWVSRGVNCHGKPHTGCQRSQTPQK